MGNWKFTKLQEVRITDHGNIYTTYDEKFRELGFKEKKYNKVLLIE